ncbi:hypothetical protein K470DRAFT_229060 [Piedraia hortae CBS 480.64]|uniref:Uncharacterized protein n=1 Tax=Piedraia hortae CBS 480.64 TaxID=1314780 RepID=A0A6A7C473_9PEZI|nr:hypothetical protein K470DRAFT_229060 [Piedraia hortae CBS 480.64]
MDGSSHSMAHTTRNVRNKESLPPPQRTHSPPESTRRLSASLPHALGETPEMHAEHDQVKPKTHTGLGVVSETKLFYCVLIPSWILEIVSAAVGSIYHTWHPAFIACFTLFMVLHWWAWLQTTVGMLQRASWVRDESDLVDRRQFLYFAVRLNRLQVPTAFIAFIAFIQAYPRRGKLDDLAFWLLFLLIFIWNTVFSVMNAYNNITWETERLQYEEGEMPFGNTFLAILGIPTTAKELPPNPKGD